MNSPSISVIIPTFNRRKYICAAIGSVLEQTRPVDQVIVVDDGSTDQTVELLTQTYGNRIRCVRQPNRGAAAARNRGLAEADGEFIAFQDSDDIWLPQKIELQCCFLRRNPAVEFVFGDMSNFVERPDFSTPEIKNSDIHSYLSANGTYLTDLLGALITENVIPTPTVMMSRRAADRVGPFNESLAIAEDLDYWLRAARFCRCGFIDRVLVARRRHPGNLVSDQNLRNACLLEVLRSTAARLCSDSPDSRARLDNKVRAICYDLGSALLKSGHFGEAAEYLRQARAPGANSRQVHVKLAIATVLHRMLLPRVRPNAPERRNVGAED